ncbi:MAG: hypothetical protein JWR13_1327 [Mycobacterium sp.]|jgi:hypothetical protein|nr:hypothetical protein [Mycobacterium sp.]MCW2730511.1 hypothetical protein [Mycobacterium sp.]MDT5075033.1 hypothetical protein [Mycobacterium sp.]MDT5316931.1 hypothetical protein [Mycobacterium sp.]
MVHDASKFVALHTVNRPVAGIEGQYSAAWRTLVITRTVPPMTSAT